MLSLRDLVDFAASSGDEGRAVLRAMGLTEEDLRRGTTLVSTRRRTGETRGAAKPDPSSWAQ
jgi:hypothetical protein